VGGEDIVEFAVGAKATAGPSTRPPRGGLAQDDNPYSIAQDDISDDRQRSVNIETLKAIPGVQSHRVDGALHQLSVSELHTAVPRIFAALEGQGLHLSEFRTHSATLEDVFVRLTGRNLRDE